MKYWKSKVCINFIYQPTIRHDYLFYLVHALEQAKASGSSIDNPEDLIASIADKVQQRQSLRIQNQQNSKNNPKLQVAVLLTKRNIIISCIVKLHVHVSVHVMLWRKILFNELLM